MHKLKLLQFAYDTNEVRASLTHKRGGEIRHVNWIIGMLLGLILVLVMWYFTRRHEAKYRRKEQLLLQKKLDRAAKRKQQKGAVTGSDDTHL